MPEEGIGHRTNLETEHSSFSTSIIGNSRCIASVRNFRACASQAMCNRLIAAETAQQFIYSQGSGDTNVPAANAMPAAGSQAPNTEQRGPDSSRNPPVRNVLTNQGVNGAISINALGLDLALRPFDNRLSLKASRYVYSLAIRSWRHLGSALQAPMASPPSTARIERNPHRQETLHQISNFVR